MTGIGDGRARLVEVLKKFSRKLILSNFSTAMTERASQSKEVLQKSWGESNLKQRYADFVIERAKLLAEAANEFLASLKSP
ncbi:MAG: hypothetical protein PWP45_1296 [Tepidanaerobacteraceae bacterium]|nr:hypothetical protein [Tepidanaerobacteraceae bacterium]